jgi:putative peptidoglycan lipid II flippase
MSADPSLGIFRNLFSRLLGVKSSRGVYFTTSFFVMLSKPLGYLRNLIIAWAFGTSAAMDAYHAASGVIFLFAGSIGVAIESSVLPEVERVRRESGRDFSRVRSLFALIAWIALLITGLLCAAFAIAPGVLVKFIASGFDPERVRMGALMIWWLSPFAMVTIFRPMADVWALFTERFTVASVCGLSFNFIAIPALLLLRPIIGPYAVAACMSVGQAAIFIIFILALGGIPMRVVPPLISKESLYRISKNAFYSVLITSCGTLYTIVDKYFASRLPTGSVAAISYGGILLALINTAALTPLSFFLAKISRLVTADPEAGEEMTRQCAAISFAYMLPIGFFTAVTAKSIVSIVFGWGNFDERSVAMTATCLAGYNLGLTFAIPATIVYRYAQARQKLGRTTPFIYAMVALNALLDWVMVSRWGLWGLALATSVTQTVSFAVYYKVVMTGSLVRFLWESKFHCQFAAISACCALLWAADGLGSAAELLIAAAVLFAYLFAAEGAGIMPFVPKHWRPSGLLFFFAQAAKSVAGK